MRLLIARGPRVLLGVVILLLAMGLKSPIALEGGGTQLSTDGLGLSWGLHVPAGDGKTDIPTANGVFAGAALVIGGLFPGMLAGGVTAIGALLIGPAPSCWPVRSARNCCQEFPAGLPQVPHHRDANRRPSPGGRSGVALSIGVAGTLAGVLLWTILED